LTRVCSDAAPVLLMMAMAFSNGYLCSVCMMHAPSMVEPADAELAGTMMAFFLTLGLTSGSCLSFAARALICKCSPF
jgi:equilibrative nucleoside transporter 1/2/3